jgi:hypothetical protein
MPSATGHHLFPPLACCPFPSWPRFARPLLPIGSRELARSRPYSPLVRPRFLPWPTDSYIPNRFHTRGLLIILEAARASETLVNVYQTTRRYNPEDSHLSTHRCENLKSCLPFCSFLATFIFTSPVPPLNFNIILNLTNWSLVSFNQPEGVSQC